MFRRLRGSSRSTAWFCDFLIIARIVKGSATVWAETKVRGNAPRHPAPCGKHLAQLSIAMQASPGEMHECNADDKKNEAADEK